METNKELILEAIKGEAYLLDEEIGEYNYIDLAIDAEKENQIIRITGVVTITDVEKTPAFINRYSDSEQPYEMVNSITDWDFDGNIILFDEKDNEIEKFNYNYGKDTLEKIS